MTTDTATSTIKRTPTMMDFLFCRGYGEEEISLVVEVLVLDGAPQSGECRRGPEEASNLELSGPGTSPNIGV